MEAADEDPDRIFKEGKILAQFKKHIWIEAPSLSFQGR